MSDDREYTCGRCGKGGLGMMGHDCPGKSLPDCADQVTVFGQVVQCAKSTGHRGPHQKRLIEPDEVELSWW